MAHRHRLGPAFRVGRLRQAKNEEITTPLLEIVDRLHAELTHEPPVT